MQEGSLSKGNAFVILGVDRVNSPLSGYGGLGDTHCAAIDIVAGRMGSKAFKYDLRRGYGEDSELLYTDPNFITDAARIYISQKSAVDKNFGLCFGKNSRDALGTPEAPAQSCVAIKADGVRIIGRQGVKIITGGDTFNAQGGKTDGTYTGIDLIANNYATTNLTSENSLQPLVKGDNLEEALLDLYDNVIALRKLIHTFLVTQRDLNRSLMTHVHVGAFMASPTSPSPPVVAEAVKNMIDTVANVEVGIIGHIKSLEERRIQYCTPGGRRYINSLYNNTN